MNDEEIENLLKIRTEESFEEDIKNRWVLKPPKDFTFPKKAPKHDENGITLYNHVGSEYFIEWYRIRNPVDCLLFINHLCNKIWINRIHIEYIITYASLKYKWGYLGKRTPFQQWANTVSFK